MIVRLKEIQNLKNVIEDILHDAKENKDYIDGAINWADLHCIRTSYALSDDGSWTWMVWIEEASEYNTQLHEFIRNRLVEKEFLVDQIEIYTEW